tara:strand:- start:650 stop:862 length:213 start_codon:yes stop_codon:yes gene_type:complete
MEINMKYMRVEILSYVNEKIRLLTSQMYRLKLLTEEIKKEDEFQDQYIDEFNFEVEELIRVAENLKINKE